MLWLLHLKLPCLDGSLVQQIYLCIYFFSYASHTCISKCKRALVVQCKCMCPSVAGNRRLTVWNIFAYVTGASKICLILWVGSSYIKKFRFKNKCYTGALGFVCVGFFFCLFVVCCLFVCFLQVYSMQATMGRVTLAQYPYFNISVILF